MINRPASLVLLEDDPAQREIIKQLFEVSKIINKIETYATYDEIIERLNTGPVPDIVFLDRYIDGTPDGDRVVDFMFNNMKFKDTTIAMTSASKLNDEDEIALASKRVDFFLIKPLRMQDIMDMLHSLDDYWTEIHRIIRNGTAIAAG